MTKEQEFNAYVMFKKEKMHFKQYGSQTLKLAIKGTPYERVLDFYISRNITIFSPDPEIKKLLKILRKFPQLVLLGKYVLYILHNISNGMHFNFHMRLLNIYRVIQQTLFIFEKIKIVLIFFYWFIFCVEFKNIIRKTFKPKRKELHWG